MTAPRRARSRRQGDEQPSAVPQDTPDRSARSEGVAFFVVGTPAPQGSKRHVGNGRMVESSKALAPWRAAVAWVASQHPLTPGPVEVTLDFALARPRSAPKSRLWPDRKPDLDKLVRSTLDGLAESGVIEDDARVVGLRAWKRYAATAEATGVGVTIRPAVVAEPQREDVA